jgi:hypothetical protein
MENLNVQINRVYEYGTQYNTHNNVINKRFHALNMISTVTCFKYDIAFFKFHFVFNSITPMLMNYLTEILNCSHNKINTKLEYGIYKEHYSEPM